VMSSSLYFPILDY